MKVLLSLKEKEKIYKEIKQLNELLNKPKKSDVEIKKLSEEIYTFNSYSFVKIIISGIYFLLNSFKINDKDELYDDIKKINEELKDINKIRSLNDIKNKFNFIKRININIEKENEEEVKNKSIRFLILISQYPNSTTWIKERKNIDFQSLEKFIIDSD